MEYDSDEGGVKRPPPPQQQQQLGFDYDPEFDNGFVVADDDVSLYSTSLKQKQTQSLQKKGKAKTKAKATYAEYNDDSSDISSDISETFSDLVGFCILKV